MRNKKPLVAVACLCERVLREEDGTLSAIRIVDTYRLRTADVPPGMTGAVSLTALIGVRSGDVEGKSEITLKLTTPSGRELGAPQSYPILLQGGESGANIIVQMALPVTELGLYRLDVTWKDELLTSIPFKLVSQTPPAPAET